MFSCTYWRGIGNRHPKAWYYSTHPSITVFISSDHHRLTVHQDGATEYPILDVDFKTATEAEHCYQEWCGVVPALADALFGWME
jgi:hypothetical protein